MLADRLAVAQTSWPPSPFTNCSIREGLAIGIDCCHHRIRGCQLSQLRSKWLPGGHTERTCEEPTERAGRYRDLWQPHPGAECARPSNNGANLRCLRLNTDQLHRRW